MAIAQNNPSPDAGCPETFRSLVREWPHADDMVLEGSGRKCAVWCPRCELVALIDAWEQKLGPLIQGVENVVLHDKRLWNVQTQTWDCTHYCPACVFGRFKQEFGRMLGPKEST